MRHLVKKPWDFELAVNIIHGIIPGVVFTASGLTVPNNLFIYEDSFSARDTVNVWEWENTSGQDISGNKENDLTVYVWEEIKPVETLVRKHFNWQEFYQDDRNYLCTKEGRHVVEIRKTDSDFIQGSFVIDDIPYMMVWHIDNGREIKGHEQFDLIMFVWSDKESEPVDETEYLLSSEANSKHLMESIDQLKNGKVKTFTADEWDRFKGYAYGLKELYDKVAQDSVDDCPLTVDPEKLAKIGKAKQHFRADGIAALSVMELWTLLHALLTMPPSDRPKPPSEDPDETLLEDSLLFRLEQSGFFKDQLETMEFHDLLSLRDMTEHLNKRWNSSGVVTELDKAADRINAMVELRSKKD